MGLGRVWKPLLRMPFRERGQALAQRTDSQRASIFGQIAGNAISRRRQYSLPLNLEVFNGATIALARVYARGRLDVLV
ncbi:conserved hypothetical protein [Ricinus communis]|uniref:Uncharacterized protein n=1 Tax=Ricinus communis TaxID=3988 RepID=B9TJA1_RICCO|nr:conserved hypothetical protein [Ricinus communis]